MVKNSPGLPSGRLAHAVVKIAPSEGFTGSDGRVASPGRKKK